MIKLIIQCATFCVIHHHDATQKCIASTERHHSLNYQTCQNAKCFDTQKTQSYQSRSRKARWVLQTPRWVSLLSLKRKHLRAWLHLRCNLTFHASSSMIIFSSSNSSETSNSQQLQSYWSKGEDDWEFPR